jgi:hypothetical protein
MIGPERAYALDTLRSCGPNNYNAGSKDFQIFDGTVVYALHQKKLLMQLQ